MRMSAPQKHPKTGAYYFRKAIPQKHREAFKAKWGMAHEAKWSLETKDPGTAKVRHNAAERRYHEMLAKVGL